MHEFVWNETSFDFTLESGEVDSYVGSVECKHCGLRAPLKDATLGPDYVSLMNELQEDDGECEMIAAEHVIYG